jgi:hypothetical protein
VPWRSSARDGDLAAFAFIRKDAAPRTLPPLDHEKFLRRSFEVARGSGNHLFGAILMTLSANWTNNGNR